MKLRRIFDIDYCYGWENPPHCRAGAEKGGDKKRGENFLKNFVIFLDNRGFGLYNCKIRK